MDKVDKNGHRAFEREHVPASKEFHISTRNNSEYKWQTSHVVGALEIESEPDLNFRTMTAHLGTQHKVDEYLAAQKAFDDLGLRDSFVQAAEGVPFQRSCCGLIRDDVKMIRMLVPYLNETWVPHANELLKSSGFRVDCFDWSWSHVIGQGETHIFLIRFHEIHHNQPVT